MEPTAQQGINLSADVILAGVLVPVLMIVAAALIRLWGHVQVLRSHVDDLRAQQTRHTRLIDAWLEAA